MAEVPRQSRPRWPWWIACLLLLAGFGLLAWMRSRPATAEDRWARIQAAAQAGAWDESSALLQDVLRQQPDDDRAWFELGRVSTMRGHDDDAINAFEHVKRSAPLWGQTQTLSGEIWIRRRNMARAEQAFAGALAAAPKAAEPLRRLVFIWMLEQREVEARRALWQLFRMTRDTRQLASLTGLAALPNPDVGELGDELELCLKQTPDDPWLQRAWGLVLVRQGKPNEARRFLEATAALIEDDPVGRLALGECQLAAREFDRAETTLGSRPARARDEAKWCVLRAELNAAKGNKDEALANWRQAVQADPENRAAHYQLGQELKRRGDAEEAARHLDRAEALRAREDALSRTLTQLLDGRRDAETFQGVAARCQEAGLLAEARAWLQETIRVDPTLSTAQAELARLKVPPESPTAPPRLRTAQSGAARPAERETEVARPPDAESSQGPQFEEVAQRAGLDFRYESGANGNLFIADTMGGGVALLDFDGDGWLDVYLVGGCKLPVDAKNPPAPNKLFRNRHDGTFEDVTQRAGVGGRGYGMGTAVGDYDNDGRPDLFVTGFGRTVLYRNRGDGTFEDVTERAGVASDRWTTAAGFGDLDGDGDLDLVAITYVAADPLHFPDCRDPADRKIHCPPAQFPAQFDHLFRNNGDGTFTDVSRDAGLEVPDGPGLGLAIADLNGDDRLDLFVANDAKPDFLFRNLGGLKFEEVGLSSGAACDGSGRATASMGVVAEDLDGDGRIDLFHTNFVDEGSTFLRGLGGGQFVDATAASGLFAPSRSMTGFGTAAFDFDNDGRIDLFAANGHVDDRPWLNLTMAQLPQLFRSKADGAFVLAPRAAPYFSKPHVGRGVAAGDLDNDGRVDLVVVHRDEPVALLRNTSKGGHWLGIRLTGRRTEVGARVTCHVGGRAIVRWLTRGTSYLGTHDARVWFGLGESRTVDRLDVHWPSGADQSWTHVAADQILELREGGDSTGRP